MFCDFSGGGPDPLPHPLDPHMCEHNYSRNLRHNEWVFCERNSSHSLIQSF